MVGHHHTNSTVTCCLCRFRISYVCQYLYLFSYVHTWGCEVVHISSFEMSV